MNIFYDCHKCSGLAVSYRDDIFRLPGDLVALAGLEASEIYRSRNLDETSRVERVMVNLTSLEPALRMPLANWQDGDDYIFGPRWVGPSFKEIFRPFRSIHHVIVLIDVADDAQGRRPLDHLSWDQLECIQEGERQPLEYQNQNQPWYHGKLAATLEQRGLGPSTAAWCQKLYEEWVHKISHTALLDRDWGYLVLPNSTRQNWRIMRLSFAFVADRSTGR